MATLVHIRLGLCLALCGKPFRGTTLGYNLGTLHSSHGAEAKRVRRLAEYVALLRLTCWADPLDVPRLQVRPGMKGCRRSFLLPHQPVRTPDLKPWINPPPSNQYHKGPCLRVISVFLGGLATRYLLLGSRSLASIWYLRTLLCRIPLSGSLFPMASALRARTCRTTPI